MRKQAIIVMLLAALTAQAQGFGIKAGFEQSIVRENSHLKPEALTSKSTLNGISVGIFYEHSVWKGFGLMYGLNYSYDIQNEKWSKGDLGWQTKTISNAHFVDVPIDLQYKFMIADQTYVVLYTGPVFHYGISNKRKNYRKPSIPSAKETVTVIDRYKEDVDQDAKADFSRFNIMWEVGLGLQFQEYTLRGGYAWGLRNYNQDGYNNISNYYMKARGDEWSISLGYFF